MQVVDHVTQSQYALQLLLPQADYAAALDIIADIQVSTVMWLHNALVHMSCLHQCTAAFLQAASDRHAYVVLLCMQTGRHIAVAWLEKCVTCNVVLVPCWLSYSRNAIVNAKNIGSMAAAFAGWGTGPSPLLIKAQ